MDLTYSGLLWEMRNNPEALCDPFNRATFVEFAEQVGWETAVMMAQPNYIEL